MSAGKRMNPRKEKKGSIHMKNSSYANDQVERALDYIKAVTRMEKRIQSQIRFRQRLQAMAEGEKRAGSDSSFLPTEGDIPGRQGAGSAAPFLQTKGDTEPTPVSLTPVSLDQELVKEMQQLQAVKEQTWELFSRLSHPKAWQTLEEFYLNGTPIRVIAARNAYNERYVYRIKSQALRELGMLLRENGIEVSG